MDINTAIELQFAIGNEHTIPITICFELAASTLFLYDYILTIRQEANCIWRRPKSLASVLFILCRYVVLVERTMMTVVMVYAVRMQYSLPRLAGQVDIGTRARVYPFVACFSTITVIILHSALAVFAAVRIYAIWRKNVFLGGLVLILGLVYPVYNILLLPSRSWSESLPPNFYTFLTSEPSLSLPVARGSFVISIWNECLVLGLTWSKTLGIYWDSRRSNMYSTKSLSYLLLRDGTTYFIAFLALSIMGIAPPSAFSSAPQGFSVFVDLCPGILITRFILNLRQDAVSATGELSDGRADLHSIVFAAQGSSRLIGNLGAATYGPGDCDESDDELHETCAVNVHETS